MSRIVELHADHGTLSRSTVSWCGKQWFPPSSAALQRCLLGPCPEQRYRGTAAAARVVGIVRKLDIRLARTREGAEP
jgi:hypothetical protein